MSQPWLSVLIPTYNGEVFLQSALDSIVTQGDSDIECIVVDDGSTDATLSILDAYKTQLQITIIQRERRGNWVANTNYALSFATGKYVCFLHQDDLWFKNRLHIMKQLIDKFPEVSFFLHSSKFIDDKGDYLGTWKCPLPIFPEIIKPKLMTEKLLIQNFISIPGSIFKRKIALKVGGLDETLWYTADWDLWLKISASSDTLYYPKPLSGFRIHLNSQTITRSSYPQDFRAQLNSVVHKYLALWDAPETSKKKIGKIADFSIEVNTTFANAFHGTKPNLAGLLISFLFLGPLGWYTYLQNSRIWERVSARLKARLKNRLEK
jgi:glycosyltransferase involved in cell wall biosynthesis